MKTIICRLKIVWKFCATRTSEVGNCLRWFMFWENRFFLPSSFYLRQQTNVTYDFHFWHRIICHVWSYKRSWFITANLKFLSERFAIINEWKENKIVRSFDWLQMLFYACRWNLCSNCAWNRFNWQSHEKFNEQMIQALNRRR